MRKGGKSINRPLFISFSSPIDIRLDNRNRMNEKLGIRNVQCIFVLQSSIPIPLVPSRGFY